MLAVAPFSCLFLPLFLSQSLQASPVRPPLPSQTATTPIVNQIQTAAAQGQKPTQADDNNDKRPNPFVGPRPFQQAHLVRFFYKITFLKEIIVLRRPVNSNFCYKWMQKYKLNHNV